MTIATFCRDELLAHGPLTPDELGERAVRVGLTRAASPRTAVTAAMRGRELELPDGRWVDPLWLLEGRCLTTTTLLQPSWKREAGDTSEHDLGLLQLVTSLQPLPLAGGGFLKRPAWQSHWRATVPLPEPAPNELLCLRVVDRSLEVTLIPAAATWTRETERFLADLNAGLPSTRLDPWARRTAVHQRLAELVLEDDRRLRAPVPPLSVCSDVLADLIEQERRWVDPWDEEHGGRLRLVR